MQGFLGFQPRHLRRFGLHALISTRRGQPSQTFGLNALITAMGGQAVQTTLTLLSDSIPSPITGTILQPAPVKL